MRYNLGRRSPDFCRRTGTPDSRTHYRSASHRPECSRGSENLNCTRLGRNTYRFWLGIFAGLFWIGCTSSTNNPNGEQIVTPKTDTVEIRGMAFVPDTITVNKGDTVLFVNRDIVDHDVTETDRKWGSSPLHTGDSWSRVFTESADYFCSLHLVMKGKVLIK